MPETPIAVRATNAHTFITEDRHESCLTCGAVYELVPDQDDPRTGSYANAAGEEPQRCTGDTSMAHGYPGERVGATTDHTCNCLMCA